MLISEELTNALNRLKNTCLLNISRTVTDFLKESAEDDELCAYIEANSPNVCFEDELHALAKTQKFPPEPNRALPFIYSVLYLFDANKLQPEDVITIVYPKEEIDEACSLFFSHMADNLEHSLEKAIPIATKMESQTEDYFEEPNEFESFVSLINGFSEADCETIVHKANELKQAADEEDLSLTKSYFYALESLLKKENISLSVLDGIKAVLEQKGVVL